MLLQVRVHDSATRQKLKILRPCAAKALKRDKYIDRLPDFVDDLRRSPQVT